jgi:hypothetical protein
MRRLLFITSLGLGGFALVGCGGGDSSADVPFADTAEFVGLDQVRSDMRAWNRAIAPLVSTYRDTSTSNSEFVRVATPIMSDLEGIVASMHGRDLTAVPASLESVVDDIIVGYDNKLSATNALVIAVQMGDAPAEQAALSQLQRAVAAANDDACQLLDEVGLTTEAASELADAFGATCT